MRDPIRTRQTAWVLLATLALTLMPWRVATSVPLATRVANPGMQEEERHDDLVESPSQQEWVLRRHGGGGHPTQAWLVLRMPRVSAPLLPALVLEHEDPRRVLIPLRIDMPPDGLA